KHVKKARKQPWMCTNAQIARCELVLPTGQAGLDLSARRNDDFCEKNGLGVRRLPTRERHEIVYDPMCQARVSLDLLDMWQARGWILSGQVGTRGDHLQRVPELVGHLCGDFTNRCKTLPCLGIHVRHAAHLRKKLQGNRLTFGTGPRLRAI